MKTRKRDTTFYVDHTINSKRVRGSLGTTDKQVASRLKSRLELAVVEGPRSENWAHLRSSLPSSTYTRFAKAAGMAVTVPPTWGGLLSVFRIECEGRIKLVKMTRSTLDRYEHTLARFTEYLDSGEDTLLADITPWLVEDFKVWRRTEILKRSNARSAGSLSLDVAVLRKIMGIAVKRSMVLKNPVTLEGTPGANPVRGAAPFSGDELARLRAAAGDDELLLLVFRHTGMRVSDVATLRWDEIDWEAKEIRKVTQKRKVEVVIPMAEELYKVLAACDQSKPYIFWGYRKNTRHTTSQIARSVRLMSQKASVFGGHPHRLRDTAAVDWLMRGATPFEVAQMLGDKLQTVERHYLSFVSPMRARVRDLMNDTSKGLEAV